LNLKIFKGDFKIMKRALILSLMVASFALPVFAQDAAAPAPAADAAVAAPAADAAAPAPAAEPAAAPAPVKLEGAVVVVKGENGAPDTITFKTADAELTLLPGDKLTELLAVEKVAEKTFVLEGEKVAAKDGKSEGFMIKSFEEKKADDAAPAAAPATEEKK